eukprot:CAMPEP_0183735740 /NCGR_PEP_ID=MMETSP0737-20130205/47527_1 /TAXON_ID=385413 /ORGANISM="Thalassiosira miniscula, Strain CCMP1093" /LENGTH=324 /DNA_ID=CAMNT_0025969571 /DNA_START=88 /DNA_END=1062 /DNA_ORIENTATION=-
MARIMIRRRPVSMILPKQLLRVTLGYKSTDTIDRGKHIYECALLEYHKIMRQDPFWVGACESVVLLLSMLGYDDLCLSLVTFMLRPPSVELIEQVRDDNAVDGEAVLTSTREARILRYTAATSELGDDVIYGPPGANNNLKFSDYDKIRDMIPKCWGANIFLIPLMLIKMRQSVGSNLFTSPPSWKLLEETVEISRQVEYSADFVLPVLRSLFPDSQQRWGKEEACALLAHVDYRELDLKGGDQDDDKSYKSNAWEETCFTFWMMLKDCYAFTPGILDALERTIERMMELGINVIPEDPPGTPTTAEHMEFIEYMAERQRNGTL